MIDAIRQVVAQDPQLAYAILFGSAARGATHAHSDVDVAVQVVDLDQFGPLAQADLAARLEAAAGRRVHLVLLNDAPPALAYRVFRDGRPLSVRDTGTMKQRLARAVLEYLDFQPVEEIFTRGVLRARHGR